jgi:hypothetical protein
MKRGITANDLDRIENTASYFWKYRGSGGLVSGEILKAILIKIPDWGLFYWELYR